MTTNPSIHACAQHVESCLHDRAEQLITEWHTLPSGPARDALQTRLGLLRIWESAISVLVTSCEELADMGAEYAQVQDVHAARLAYIQDNAQVFTLSPELAAFVASIPEQEKQRGRQHAQELAAHPKLQRQSAKARKNVQQLLDGMPDEYERMATPVLAFLSINQRMADIRRRLEQREDMQQVDALLGPWGNIPRADMPQWRWH